MFNHLSVLSKCESDQRLHGLNRVGIDYPWSGWPLGGSETGMESSASKEHPPPPPPPPSREISGAFRFHLPLLEPPFHLSSFFFSFFFGSDFATASSSSSTPATASSLAPVQYLIRTNYVATSI